MKIKKINNNPNNANSIKNKKKINKINKAARDIFFKLLEINNFSISKLNIGNHNFKRAKEELLLIQLYYKSVYHFTPF